MMGKLDAVASRNRVFAMNVPRWKEKYWSINEANYERERIGRWGKCVSYDDDERREPNSDTDGRSKDEDEDEDRSESESRGQSEGEDEEEEVEE